MRKLAANAASAERGGFSCKAHGSTTCRDRRGGTMPSGHSPSVDLQSGLGFIVGKDGRMMFDNGILWDAFICQAECESRSGERQSDTGLQATCN